MMKFKLLFISFCIVCLWIGSGESETIDISLDQVNKKLTNGSNKEWILDRFKTIMGQKKKCNSGKSYTFYENGKVVITECINNTLSKKEFTWAVTEENELDKILTIGKKTYYILFRDLPTSELMRLRKKSDSKKEITVDMEFRYEED